MTSLVSFSEPLVLGFKKSAGGLNTTVEANRPYVFAQTQLNNIMQEEKVQQRTYKISQLQPRIQNFHVDALKKNQSVILFNACGGYGDQIMTWPVARLLSDLGARVHILTDPGNNVCWWNLPFVKSISTVPFLWETFKLYDHAIVFDTVVNLDEHTDQEHPVDAMLRRIGVDPETVPDTDKVVRPVFTPSELGTLSKWMGKRVGLYQISGSNPVRALPPGDSAHIAATLAVELPDTHWLCLHDEFVPEDYVKALKTEIEKLGLANIEPFASKNLRELWALTEYASVVVAPDSMMVHIAGVFSTPCVGLWGPMNPANRVKYYANHTPLWPKDFCPHAPCFAYSGIFPRYCPPRPGKRTVCDVLAGIRAGEVVAAVKQVRR